MFYKVVYHSPLGTLSLVALDDALYGIWLEGQKYYEAGLEEESLIRKETPVLKQAVKWLEAYFRGDQTEPLHIPLADRGTPFQKQVWALLRQIPYGETKTYGQLAQSLTCGSAQAVGSAVGRNPWLILVPCHRVLASSNQIRGYAASFENKVALLELEGVTVDKK